MDLIDGMRAFSQVVATGSFTEAGTRLGISNKLVSKYVAQLEDRLGTRLLNRTTRRSSLTEAGTFYYERCRQILDDLDELEQSVQSVHASPRGKLIISAPATFAEFYLMPLFVTFQKNYPDVSIDLRLTDRFVDLAEEGVDVALRIGMLENSTLIARKLAPAPLIVCASPNYLASAGTPTHPSELKHHECIVDMNYRAGAQWPFLIDGEKVHIPISGKFSVNSAPAARDYALSGQAIVMCPAYIARPHLDKGELVPILENYATLDLSLYAVFNTKRHLAPKIRVFIDFLSAQFQASNLI